VAITPLSALRAPLPSRAERGVNIYKSLKRQATVQKTNLLNSAINNKKTMVALGVSKY
jgi:hypothetical protein